MFSPSPPLEGAVKAGSPFSLREKVGMRGYKNQSIRSSGPLTLTLSRGERGLNLRGSGISKCHWSLTPLNVNAHDPV